MAFGTNKGFSLIELLVVVIVIISITGFSISNYTAFIDTQRLKQGGKTFVNDLRFIQNRAMSSIKSRECGESPLIAYRISFSQNTYSYASVCLNGVFPEAGGVFSLPDRIIFSPIPSSFDIAALTGKPSRSLVITLTNGSKTYRVQITDIGSIEDIGFQ